MLQITCCMSDIKKNRESIFITPPPLPPKNILRPKTERERGNLFFNLILEGLVLCIIIHFSFEYALYSLTFLLSLSCCIFFLSLIVNMFNGFFLFVVNAACLGLGRLWFYFWTFFFAFLFQCSVDNDALFFFKHLCCCCCCSSSCFTSCCCCLISLFFFHSCVRFLIFCISRVKRYIVLVEIIIIRTKIRKIKLRIQTHSWNEYFQSIYIYIIYSFQFFILDLRILFFLFYFEFYFNLSPFFLYILLWSRLIEVTCC